MVKIGSRLIQQHLLSRASAQHAFIKDADLLQFPVSLEAQLTGRSLKAVYPHFVEAKRKSGAERSKSSGNLSHKELYCEMDKARQSYKEIREIQDQLSLVYQELMLTKNQ